MIIKVSQNEQNENGSVEDILAKEIESWKDFSYALREEDALLFDKVLSECRQNKDYIRAVISKGQNYSAESVFILLILQQQKMSALASLLLTDILLDNPVGKIRRPSNRVNVYNYAHPRVTAAHHRTTAALI
jgi:hypothetical protein